MESKWTKVTLEELLEPAAPTRADMQGVRVGVVTIVDATAGVWIACDELSDEAIEARSTVPVAPDDEGRSVLLVFEGGRPDRPIITGFIQEQPVASPVTLAFERETVDEARVDDEQVRLHAQKEIVLQCGRSSITLRADGKIIIKGRELVSRAQQTNKIKGGTVRIN